MQATTFKKTNILACLDFGDFFVERDGFVIKRASPNGQKAVLCWFLVRHIEDITPPASGASASANVLMISSQDEILGEILKRKAKLVVTMNKKGIRRFNMISNIPSDLGSVAQLFVVSLAINLN